MESKASQFAVDDIVPRLPVQQSVNFRESPRSDDLLLDTVLNNMSQGVLMFDADRRLLFYNQRYAEMYGLQRNFAKLGCALRDILAQCMQAGLLAAEVELYVARLDESLAERRMLTSTVGAGDGRIFSIVDKPIQGGGWLSTHEDVTERQRAQAQIAHMARHDALTDLPNRVLMRERLEHELKRVRRGDCLAVFCLDLDHFKSVNDTLGHPVGDGLLKSVADRLRGCVREIDTIARLGGDEFAIIMTQIQQPDDAVALARRIRESIVRPYQIDGHQIVVDISIGVSVAPMDGTDPDRLLKNADMALYGAKDDGRGTYRFFETEMDLRMKTRRDLEMDLRKAFMYEEFEMYYQPLVNLQTNEITAFESLLRWNHPTRGLVSPGDFIPIAEETGLIVQLGEWVLRTACKEAIKWPEHIKIAVNLSPVQLKDRKLLDVVKSAIADAGLAASRLQLEITESILMQNTFATLAILHELRKLGVQIAMDDFGTGYSSLSYLRSFPFDKIKIDRSFIEDISNGAEPYAIVNAVAGLANCLNMVSTAEGVETSQQRDTLQSMGCTEMQGYLFSKARPAGEVSQFFTKKLAVASDAA